MICSVHVVVEGSDLFLKYVVPDLTYDAINLRVWRATPFIVDAYTGSLRDDRAREMIAWCRDHFGVDAWPFSDNPRPGRWQRGSATVFGWTWFGFSTEAEMRDFEAAWPAPTPERASPGRGEIACCSPEYRPA